MLIAAATQMYPPESRVGAWLTTHEFLAALAERGHEVRVHTELTPGTYVFEGVSVNTGATLDELGSWCDVMVSHLGDRGRAARAAFEAAKPSVRMVHGFADDLAARLDRWPTDLAVFNAEWMQEAAKWDGTSIVAHPPVHPYDFTECPPGDLVTLINLSEVKGGRILAALAARMPDVKFLGVRGSYASQLEVNRPNVEVIDPVIDMASHVYRRTAILLMPSVQESWGRVGVEALYAGIPTIASPCNGPIEALGDAGTFVELDDLDGWEREIRRLLDPEEWELASKRCTVRSEQFHPLADIDRFLSAVEALA